MFGEIHLFESKILFREYFHRPNRAQQRADPSETLLYVYFLFPTSNKCLSRESSGVRQRGPGTEGVDRVSRSSYNKYTYNK